MTLSLPQVALGCMGFGSSAWRPWVLDEKESMEVLARLWTRPAVTTPVVGATRLEHIEDALAAAEMSLPNAMLSRLSEAYSTRPYIELPESASNQTVLEPIDSCQ